MRNEFNLFKPDKHAGKEYGENVHLSCKNVSQCDQLKHYNIVSACALNSFSSSKSFVYDANNCVIIFFKLNFEFSMIF